MLVCEVREWEQWFWNKFKAFLDEIGKYRVEETERLTRVEGQLLEDIQSTDERSHEISKRMVEVDYIKGKGGILKSLGEQWALSFSLLFEGGI